MTQTFEIMKQTPIRLNNRKLELPDMSDASGTLSGGQLYYEHMMLGVLEVGEDLLLTDECIKLEAFSYGLPSSLKKVV